MKNILCGLILGIMLLLCGTAYGQTGYYTDTRDEGTLPNAVAGEIRSPNSEHYLALQHLKHATLREDREFTVFFSLYSVPKELQDTSLRLLNGTIMSISAGDKAELVKSVRGSNTLFWIDIRDYNWNRKAWEVVAATDPYFQEPWLNDEDVDEFINVGNKFDTDNVLAVNFIVNGAWFIANTLDATRQDDIGVDELYYELLYSNLGGTPANLADFRNIWGVDDDRVDTFGQARGTIVRKGESAVARNERQIAGVGTDLGYYYETSDFKTGVAKLIDNLDPVLSLNVRDASEAIASNGVGWQVYWLAAFINGIEQRVEFADPTVAVDTSSRTDDIRVRMVVSCMTCHTNGLNPGDDYLATLIGKDISLNIDDRDLAHALKSFYANDFNGRLIAHRKLYEYAVKRDTGWTSAQFVENLQKFYSWYSQPLDVYQAAREAGVDTYAFLTKTKASASGAIAGLHREQYVPRDLWEIGDDSVFVESMLLIYRSQIVQNTRQQQQLVKEVEVKEELKDEIQTVVTERESISPTLEATQRDPQSQAEIQGLLDQIQSLTNDVRGLRTQIDEREDVIDTFTVPQRIVKDEISRSFPVQNKGTRFKEYFDLYWKPSNTHYKVYRAEIANTVTVYPTNFPSTTLHKGSTVYVYDRGGGHQVALFYGDPKQFRWVYINDKTCFTPVWKWR